MNETGNTAFIVEAPLGKLAKWLRILGFDTIYEPDIETREGSTPGIAKRIRLTRTRRKPMKTTEGKPGEKPHRHAPSITASAADKPAAPHSDPGMKRPLLIRSDHPLEQLKQVITEIHVDISTIRPFSRCNLCNEIVQTMDKSEARGLIPDYVWETHDEFKKCGRCNRIFWPGTHAERVKNRLESIFDEPSHPPHQTP